jgi:hypothetical protein
LKTFPAFRSTGGEERVVLWFVSPFEVIGAGVSCEDPEFWAEVNEISVLRPERGESVDNFEVVFYQLTILPLISGLWDLSD